MGSVRIKFNYPEFAILRQDAAVNAELKKRAEAIAARANELAGIDDGFVAVESPGKDRARWVVIAETEEARRLEATRGCLTRALEAGNG